MRLVSFERGDSPGLRVGILVFQSEGPISANALTEDCANMVIDFSAEWHHSRRSSDLTMRS